MQPNLNPIGRIQSPFNDIEGMPIQPPGAAEVAGEIVIDPAFEPGLCSLEEFSHIFVLYWFHRCKGVKLKVKPFMDDAVHGVFATRAPCRPNPIGLSVVELIGREKNTLKIRGVDILNGTPVLDIKPYVPKFDAPRVRAIGWLAQNHDKAERIRSDDRFRS